MAEFERILLRDIGKPNSWSLQTYEKGGGYKALKKALSTYSPDEVIELVKSSGLRGRGGAGFPTGVKWSFVPKDTDKPKYVVANADEGEPGTFKDRVILEEEPHMLIEGIILAAYAIGAHESYIYLRKEYPLAKERLLNAIEEARKAGYLGKNILNSGFDIEIYVYIGAGAYICGEETALLESLEGRRGHPRKRPPFPATHGLYLCPTVVNNVETLANVPFIVIHGPAWYRQFGTEKSPGTKLFSCSGAIKRPGVYEIPLGSITLKQLVFDVCGGMKEGHELFGVIPGGVSAPILTPEEIDVPLDYESIAAKGSMLGSGGVIVLDKSFSAVTYARRAAEFYAEESCGKCVPCREGTPWLVEILKKIESEEGTEEDYNLLLDIAKAMRGKTFCPLGDSAACMVENFATKYKEDFEALLKKPVIV